MKILILADFAAPYRKAVFEGIAKKHDIDVFFNVGFGSSRNTEWYAKSDDKLNFYVLNTQEALQEYNNSINNIEKYNLVICYDPWPKRSRKLQRLCMKKKIPFILNADGVVEINKNFPKKQIKTYYVKRAAMLFAGCERAKQYFKTYGGSDDKIIVHPFTSLYESDIALAPYTVDEKRKNKKELNVQNIPMFLAVGRFVEVKGFELLLEAWEKVQQPAQLYIIGGGPLKEVYEQIICDKKLENVYLEDFKTPSQLKKYYKAGDIFVMPSCGDIWGLVVNEAMAEGLPVISSDLCTAGVELIKEGENGYVYPCNNTDLLAYYINRIIDEKNMWEKYSQNSLNIIKDYTLENIIKTHLKCIEKFT